MPILPARWLLPLLGLFLAVASVDVYLTYTAARPAPTAAAERLDAAAFLAAAAAGELTGGRILYRPHVAGLADLSATRGEAQVETTTRLTDADLSVLRAHHFAEQDAATLALSRPRSARDRASTIVHGVAQGLGLLLVLGLVIVVLQRVLGRSTNFA
ncbi:MAG TPA: hypothetical protein VHF69_09725, partial [Candidatus Synoicihabitans sp.]|nr:hypothetical protein [Candidatus Synoicihabitans sp.]